MKFTRQETENSVEFIVNELLSLEDAEELHPALLEMLEKKEKIRINLRGQEEIGIHGLQLLCAAHRSAIKRHKQLALTNCSPPLREMVRMAGFIRQESCVPGAPCHCLWTGGAPANPQKIA